MLYIARVSAIKFVNEMIDVIKAKTQSEIPIVYQDWDAHADLQELPDADIIGINGFGISEDEQQFELAIGVTLSTYNDPNIFRLTRFADEFFTAMRLMKQFQIYDPTTGDAIGTATFANGTTVTPVQRVEIRPTMSVAASAKMVVRSPSYTGTASNP